jgi:hypothetical protein
LLALVKKEEKYYQLRPLKRLSGLFFNYSGSAIRKAEAPWSGATGIRQAGEKAVL